MRRSWWLPLCVGPQDGQFAAELARKIDNMEQKYDAQFKVVFDAIRQLMAPPLTPRRQIGFHAKPEP